MSCSAALYACNTNTQTIPATTATTINFGNPVRRYGQVVDLSGGNVSVTSAGYFDVETNFTLTAAAGAVTIAIYNDGVAVPGATATITAVADTVYAVSIPCIIRNKCCCETEITATITSVGAAVISNAAIEVTKI